MRGAVPNGFDGKTGDKKLGTPKNMKQGRLSLLSPMYPVSPVFFEERERESECEGMWLGLLLFLSRTSCIETLTPLFLVTLSLSKKDWGHWVHWIQQG